MSSILIGEGFAGSGPHAAHINTVLGPRDGPVGTAWAQDSSTSAIGRAGAVTGPAETERSPAAGAPTSAMLPHAWHSGQRPTHLADA